MKTFKSLFLLLFVSVFVLSVNSCKKDGDEELGAFNKDSGAEKFHERIAAQGSDAQILDYRSAEEFAAGHIPGAINIEATVSNTASNNSSFATAVLATFDKTKPLYMYGGTGGSSASLEYVVPGRISKIGFGKANTWILLGGFDTWVEAYPNEVEK